MTAGLERVAMDTMDKTIAPTHAMPIKMLIHLSQPNGIRAAAAERAAAALVPALISVFMLECCITISYDFLFLTVQSS